MSVKGKVKMRQQKENGKKANVCLEFGLANYTTQTIWKNRTEIISVLTKMIIIHQFIKFCKWEKYLWRTQLEGKKLLKNVVVSPFLDLQVITWWGTWLEAAAQYSKNFELTKCVINKFDADESYCNKEFQWPVYWTSNAYIYLKNASIVSRDVEFSQNIWTYLPTTDRNFCFKTYCTKKWSNVAYLIN